MQRNESDFSWLITNKSVVVSYDGVSHTFLKEDRNCDPLIVAIRAKNWDAIPELLSPGSTVSKFSDGEMRIENGQVWVKIPNQTTPGEKEVVVEWPVPSGLNTTILKYLDQGLPFKPLVRFAVKLSQNPSARSIDQLFDFLDKNNFTITEDGKFIAYKKVRSDFKDIHSGKFDNSVGQTVEMPREEVDDDPEHVCSRGLHAANFEYQDKHFGGPGGISIFVEIDPKDVVSVPVDYNFSKMRVCRYKVLGIIDQEITTPIYENITPSTSKS